MLRLWAMSLPPFSDVSFLVCLPGPSSCLLTSHTSCICLTPLPASHRLTSIYLTHLLPASHRLTSPSSPCLSPSQSIYPTCYPSSLGEQLEVVSEELAETKATLAERNEQLQEANFMSSFRAQEAAAPVRTPNVNV